jgi:hypothetical protein
MQQKTKFFSRDGKGLQFSPKNKKLIREVKFFLTASPRIYNITNIKMSKKQEKYKMLKVQKTKQNILYIHALCITQTGFKCQ